MVEKERPDVMHYRRFKLNHSPVTITIVVLVIHFVIITKSLETLHLSVVEKERPDLEDQRRQLKHSSVEITKVVLGFC
jgi:hypothetical protein